VLDTWRDDDEGWYGDLVAERSAAARRRGEAPTPRTSGRPGLEARLATIAHLRSVAADSGIPLYPVRVRATGAAIGYVGLVVGRSTPEEPELAYELLESAHGNGSATEAARAVVDAARAAGFERLWATIWSWNAPSLRVAAKLGFVLDHVEDGNHWMRRDL
jgi:RimJ/RimL family protein N-acetyltransferase